MALEVFYCAPTYSVPNYYGKKIQIILINSDPNYFC